MAWVEPFIKARTQQVVRKPFRGQVMMLRELGVDPRGLIVTRI